MTRFDHSLLNQLPDVVLAVTHGYRICYANHATQRYLKVAPADLLGQPIQTLLAGVETLLEAAVHNPHVKQEMALQGRYFELLITPTYDETLPEAYILFLRDITVRKHTETILLANERRYRALFENSNDAIFIFDTEHSILIANQQAADLLGVPLETLLGSPIDHYLKPEDLTDHHAISRRILAGETVPIYETTFRRNDGRLIATEVSEILVRDAHGEALHVQMIVRDITARKQLQQFMNQRLEQLAILRRVNDELTSSLDIAHVVSVGLSAAVELSQAYGGFIAIAADEGLQIADVSGAYDESYLGFPLRYDLGIIGRVMAEQRPELIADVSRDPDYHVHLPATRAQMTFPLISQEILIGLMSLEADRDDVFTEEIFQFIQAVGSRIAAALDNARLYQFARDRAQELEALYNQMSRLEQLKTDMLRMASHDLKNPVGIVLGYLDLLAIDQSMFNDDYNAYFSEMRRAAQRMSKIVQDILSLERIEQQAMAQGSLLDLVEQVQRVVEDYQSQMVQKQINLAVEMPSHSALYVSGDAVQLYEAITNLVSNAIKYTPAGGTITVRLSQDDHSIVFEVQDTGYGIPAERQARLFQPFYRVHTNETQDIEGTGLGLHLVKNVVERHGGQMRFASEYGKGSTFGFRLPVAP